MSTTPSARTALAEVLRIRLPDGRYRLIDGPNLPANVTKPTILLWQDRVTRTPQVSHDRLTVSLVVWLLTGLEGPKAEDQLEDGLTDLIEALRPVTWATWSEAERLTYGDSADGPAYHSYRLILTCLAQIGD